MSRILLLVLFVTMVPLVGSARAQSGSTTDILTGTVLGPSGEPIVNASVTAVSRESGLRRSTITNAQGRFTIIFPGGGGYYEVLAAHIGMRSELLAATRGVDEDVVVVEFRLAVAPILLQEILVMGEGELLEAGAQERILDGDWLSLLPIDPRDLAAVAALNPGVVGLEASDSIGSGGFSILSQRPDLNHIAVDGMSFGSPRGGPGGDLGLPAEAVRLTRVITNSYDVARGQFSGGQISSTTRGGSNRREGSLTYSLHEPRLQWHGDGSPFNRAYTQHRLSGAHGGPIVRDRLFYFGSAAVQRRSQGLASLMHADGAALEQLGAHPDSVARFLETLRVVGLSPTEPIAASQQLIDDVSVFGRLDFVKSDRHTLMLRGDGRWNRREGTRVSSLGLPHSGGENLSAGGGLMVGVTSKFSAELVNEFRAYVSRQDADAEPYFPVPEGRVRVTSELDDGTKSVSNLLFGGNRALPVTSYERTVEMSNELLWSLGGRHRLKLGALMRSARTAQEFSPSQYGSFSFDSLEDFASNRPTSFSRSLTTAAREGGGLNLALYLGNTSQALQNLQLTYGLRAEGSHFGRRPDYNPLVESLFDRRTDQFPSELHVSPRLGFTYLVGADARGQSPAATIRGGIGEFYGRAPLSIYSTALDATGLPDSQIQIVCVGSSVPAPAWTSYRNGSNHIPERCADGELTQQSSGRAPNVTVFAPDFGAPRSWRASLAVERRLGKHFTTTVEGIYNHGIALYGVSDLNLRPAPEFFLGREANRPVYVGSESIIESSGRVSMLNSRIHPQFGQVLEVHSDLRSSSTQFTTNLRGNLPSKVSFSASYTASFATDQSSFSCCSALQGFGSSTTAGAPNAVEWGTSDFERRHSIRANSGLPIRPWLEMTILGQAASGTPFTPLIGGDINGDGARNDRAFVFDPAAAVDPAVALGMNRLLAEAPARISRCLSEQMGGFAGRNSCRGAWESSMELRLNARPELPSFGRRLTASIASQNLLTGVDRLVNGRALQGWGQRSSPDATLLYPRSYDPETRTFGYEVNERFGNSRQGQLPFGSPFQLHVEARMALGPQRPR
jgi:hypothetical protein